MWRFQTNFCFSCLIKQLSIICIGMGGSKISSTVYLRQKNQLTRTTHHIKKLHFGWAGISCTHTGRCNNISVKHIETYYTPSHQPTGVNWYTDHCTEQGMMLEEPLQQLVRKAFVPVTAQLTLSWSFLIHIVKSHKHLIHECRPYGQIGKAVLRTVFSFAKNPNDLSKPRLWPARPFYLPATKPGFVVGHGGPRVGVEHGLANARYRIKAKIACKANFVSLTWTRKEPLGMRSFRFAIVHHLFWIRALATCQAR